MKKVASCTTGNDTKRTSSRVRTLSKGMRYVDEDTRKEVRDRRLIMLEADNYVEEQEIAAANEDVYGESDEDSTGAPKKKRQKPQINPSSGKSKWTTKKIKSLERMIVEQGYQVNTNPRLVGDTRQHPNYISIAAEASILPARHFCSVCGYLGKYSCTRCGSRFCSIRCNENHKETRCMKFSI